ncbi:cell shape-determining protein MreD [Caballeronia udeis]|jgi:cell shape-determining protein MreD|uniref:Cell shape-determining protein MreD n=1 Tax=Caballeronia udeis TaxID=1232866 RepID=A0ABW8MAI6_9BURK
MNFPWFPLIVNFLLLALFVFVCNTLNTGRRTSTLNGALIFIGFCCLAMLLDFTLTFVFASATTTDRERYIDLSSLSACGERALAYAIPCAVAAVMALRFRVRSRNPVEPSVIIHTSEYTQSELRY